MKKNNLFVLLLSSFILLSCNSTGDNNSQKVSSDNSSLLNSEYSSVNSENSNSEENSSFTSSSSLVSLGGSLNFNSGLSLTHNQYDIVVVNGEGSKENALEGETITIKASEPETGYEFDCWKDSDNNVVSKESTYTFKVTKDITLTANYKKIKYSVTVTGGTGTGEYEYGDKVTVSATLSDGEKFLCWVDENGVEISKDNPYIFEVTSNKNIFLKVESTSKTPSNVDEFKLLLLDSAIVQEETSSVTYSKVDNKYSSSYSSESISENVIMYEDSLFVEGVQSTYSNYNYNRIVKIDNDRLYDVKKYEGSYPTSSATSYKLVNEVTDGDKQMSLKNAQSLVKSYSVVKNLLSILNDVTIFAVEDNFSCNKVNNDFKVVIDGHNETSTMYNTINFEIIYSSDLFISSIKITRKDYIKATSWDESTNSLKVDAVSKNDGSLVISYICNKGEKSVAPLDKVDIAPYFISDYEIKGRYYENNTQRYFSSAFPYIWKGARITESYIEMDADSINPTTKLESTDLTFVSVSDESKLSLVRDSNNKIIELVALDVGNVSITMASSSGVEKTLNLEIKEYLPPVSFEIDCQDTVLVNEQISLNVKNITPSSSDSSISWSVDDLTRACIVEENGQYFLKGLSSGFVTLTATSTSDNSITSSKTVFVSGGELTNAELQNVIVGKWLAGSNDETKAFVVEFLADGTISILDNYRRATKITSTGTWTLTSGIDSSETHRGTNVSSDYSDYLVVSANMTLDNSVANVAEYLEIHFAISKDGSKMIMHFAVYSDGNHQQQIMTKKSN